MPLCSSQMSLKTLFVFKSDGLALELCALGALELGCLVGLVRRLGYLFFRVSISFLQDILYPLPCVPALPPSVLSRRLPRLKPPLGNIRTPLRSGRTMGV